MPERPVRRAPARRASRVGLALASTAVILVGGSIAVPELARASHTPQVVSPGSALAEQIVLPCSNTNPATLNQGVNSVAPLLAGETYRIEVEGTCLWGLGDADAECTTNVTETPITWIPDRYSNIDPHALDVLVNGVGTTWLPSNGAPECNLADHKYFQFHTAGTTGQVNFRFHDGIAADNVGTFTIKIFLLPQGLPPSATVIDSFQVDSQRETGANSNVNLSPESLYVIEVVGFADIGLADSTHDAECFYPFGGPGQRLDASDKVNQGNDMLVNLTEVDWEAAGAGVAGCDPQGHRYTVEFIPRDPGKVNLRVRDGFHADNDGKYQVRIFLIGSVPSGSTVDNVSTGTPRLVEEIIMPCNNTNPTTFNQGARSATPLVAARVYRIEIEGTCLWGLGNADAECATLATESPETWLPGRFSSIDPDALEVLINNKGGTWLPSNGAAECNTDTHKYFRFFAAEETGPITFTFNDSIPFENVGTFTIKLLALPVNPPPAGVVIDQFQVHSANPAGTNSNVSLETNKKYAIEVVGKFSVGFDATSHDAECIFGNLGPGQRADQLDKRGDGNDVLVRGLEVDWSAQGTGLGGCDNEGNRYTVLLEPPVPAGKVNLRVRDTGHFDNTGVLDVRIFRLAT